MKFLEKIKNLYLKIQRKKIFNLNIFKMDKNIDECNTCHGKIDAKGMPLYENVYQYQI
jgi:hypothetical protein